MLKFSNYVSFWCYTTMCVPKRVLWGPEPLEKFLHGIFCDALVTNNHLRTVWINNKYKTMRIIKKKFGLSKKISGYAHVHCHNL